MFAYGPVHHDSFVRLGGGSFLQQASLHRLRIPPSLLHLGLELDHPIRECIRLAIPAPYEQVTCGKGIEEALVHDLVDLPGLQLVECACQVAEPVGKRAECLCHFVQSRGNIRMGTGLLRERGQFLEAALGEGLVEEDDETEALEACFEARADAVRVESGYGLVRVHDFVEHGLGGGEGRSGVELVVGVG